MSLSRGKHEHVAANLPSDLSDALCLRSFVPGNSLRGQSFFPSRQAVSPSRRLQRLVKKPSEETRCGEQFVPIFLGCLITAQPVNHVDAARIVGQSEETGSFAFVRKQNQSD